VIVQRPTLLDLSFLRAPAVQRRIAITTLALAAVGALYGLLAPKWYRSVVTVVPAKPQRAAISSLLGSELGGLAAGLDASSGGAADANRIAAVLQSVAVSDAVVEKFDLRKRYDQRFQEAAREALWRHCDVKMLPKPSLVQLSCEDTDPRFVQEMLAFFADYGNQVFRRVGVSSASEEVKFLEKRISTLRQEAESAASRMREFQEKHRIVDLDTQAKAVVSSLAALNSQRIAKQLEFDYARTFSSQDEATMQQIQSQLSVVNEKLRDLEDLRADDASEARDARPRRKGGEVFPAALSIPKLRAEFEALYRERKVAEASLLFALERLEGAKANEARDVSTFLVLDPPTLPTRKARPKLLQSVAGAAALGFALAIAIEAWRSRRAARPVTGP